VPESVCEGGEGRIGWRGLGHEILEPPLEVLPSLGLYAVASIVEFAELLGAVEITDRFPGRLRF
jgi:hypothetical protein